MRSTKNKPIIAHIISHYLYTPENWIFTQIITQQKTHPIVLTRTTSNLDQFPLKEIYKYPLLSDVIKSTSLPLIMVRKLLALAQRFIDLFPDFQLYFYEKILRETNSALIHAHFGPTGYKAIALKERIGLPLVVSFYGSDAYQLPYTQPIWKQRYIKLFELADAIIVKNKAMEKQLLKLDCPKEKISVIEQGIRLDQIPFRKRKLDGKVKFLVASRLEPVKGISIIIKAFKKLTNKIKDSSLTIIGSGGEEGNLKQLILNLKIIDKVEIIPQVTFNELIKKAEDHHIFVSHSITANDQQETDPNSLLERLASGMPVISTMGSVAVQDGINGFLVPEGSIMELAKTMTELAKMTGRWEKFGKAGRKIVMQKYNAKKHSRKREKLYLSFINSIKSPSPQSINYWEKRYQSGGDSGFGSKGKLAEFKAKVINKFVSKNKINSIIEFGCGEGKQLRLGKYPSYIGLDVSKTAISMCKIRFSKDQTKKFLLYEPLTKNINPPKAELGLSLDVIYHLIEKDIYTKYLKDLFSSSAKFVIIYSSNISIKESPVHIKHRRFTTWIDSNLKKWKLIKKIPNKYPFKGDHDLQSFSDFYIYKKVA